MDLGALDLSALSKWAGTALVAVAVWTYQKIDNRVTKLEDERVTKEDFNQLRSEVREDVRTLGGKIDDLTRDVIEALKR